MGLVDSLKGFMGMDDDFYEDEYDDVYEDEYEDDRAERPRSRFTRKTDNVVNMSSGEGTDKSIAIIKAKKYEDATSIADVLKNRRPVIFDVGEVENDGEAEKIVDFMSGAVFGLNGDIKRVSGGIFIAVPANMDITNEDLRRNVKGSIKFDF